jgi:hypothetical protein
MFKIEFDYAELSKAALSLNEAAESQIPYACALALNRSADVTRNLLIKTTWPTHVTARNPSFIAASLTTKEARATKSMLSVEIYDKLNRGNLQMQAKGGTRTPKGGGNLAVPVSNIKRTSRGVPSRLRPRNLKVAVKRNGMLYSKDSKGRLKLLYALKPTTKIPKRVPFYEDFTASMAREMNRTLPLAIAHAMKTRRR